jgi:BirA family biotin operon repressor/biotin-[acetyl-CoA-carboxylase] ligase
VKWPNDLVHDWKKLGGILVESTGDMLGPTAAVVGVGLNFRLGAPLAARIDQPATDLASVCTALPSRNALLARLLAELTSALGQFGRDGFAAFREDWRARHAYAGRRVQVLAADQPARAAEVIDVAADGALLVAIAGRTERLTSAEISLRPLPESEPGS